MTVSARGWGFLAAACALPLIAMLYTIVSAIFEGGAKQFRESLQWQKPHWARADEEGLIISNWQTEMIYRWSALKDMADLSQVYAFSFLLDEARTVVVSKRSFESEQARQVFAAQIDRQRTRLERASRENGASD